MKLIPLIAGLSLVALLAAPAGAAGLRMLSFKAPGALVSLNPQPIPPKESYGALNPQPIPPKESFVALNPQPIPPKESFGALNPQPIPPKELGSFF